MSIRGITCVVFSASVSFVVASCASSGASSTSPPSRPDRVVTTLGTSTGSSTGSRTGSLAYYTDEGYESVELPISADDAWPLLLQAYEDLGLTLGIVDTEARVLGNPELIAPRRIAGHRMSRLFRCGDTMTGPVADASSITINLESRLDEVEGGSVISTLVRGTAIPRDGTGGMRPCTSSGQLETEIHESVLRQLVVGVPGL